MEINNLHIKSGKNTPEAIGDVKSNKLTINGNCYPEDIKLFYKPVISWIENISKNSNKICVDCQFYYISSSSVISTLKLLQLTESLFDKVNIVFNWRYEIGDEDIKKIGQDFSNILDNNMNIIEVAES
jgi:hypothetical protein